MTKLTDGKKTVGTTMAVWTGDGYTPDWSNDFYDVGCLEYDEEKDAYIVDDVEYCIEQAMDWKNSEGDYSSNAPNEDNNVDVEEF